MATLKARATQRTANDLRMVKTMVVLVMETLQRALAVALEMDQMAETVPVMVLEMETVMAQEAVTVMEMGMVMAQAQAQVRAQVQA